MNDAAASPSQLASLLESLGERARRRPEPRLSVVLAGAGCALAVIGVLVVAGDTGAGDGGDFNSIPGLVLSVLVVVAGFLTMQQADDGAVATAGAVAGALGIPPTLFFLTFDSGSLPPYSSETILVVSTIAWLVAYCVGPAKGRSVFLGAGLIGLWLTVLQLTENVFDSPFGRMGFSETTTFTATGDSVGGYSPLTSLDTTRRFGGGLHGPDPTVLGLLSLGLGVAFVVGTRWLDRRDRQGAATAFALAAIPPLVAGAFFMWDDLDQAGTGLLLAVVGLALVRHGSTTRRRATTWIGGALSAVGLATIVFDITEDATVGGVLLVVVGLGLVAVGYLLANLLDEPTEFVVTTGIAALGAPAGSRRGVTAPATEPAPVITAPVATIAPVAEPAPPARKAPAAKKTAAKKTAAKKAAPAKKTAAKKAAPAPRRRPPTTP